MTPLGLFSSPYRLLLLSRTTLTSKSRLRTHCPERLTEPQWWRSRDIRELRIPQPAATVSEEYPLAHSGADTEEGMAVRVLRLRRALGSCNHSCIT